MKRPTAALIRICVFLGLLSLVACHNSSGLDQQEDQVTVNSDRSAPVQVQVVEEPVIDGVIGELEWGSAVVKKFSDGSEVYLMLSGETLFAGIRAASGGMIAGNVFLEEGDKITVMHTSAALGTALYQKDGEEYIKIKDFEWCCRSKIDDALSRSAREAFYAEEGWLGINSFLGAENELEYRISLESQTARLAFNFIHADNGGEKQVWPVGLGDGVALPTSGGFPDLITFDVEEWIRLQDIR